MLFQSQKEYFFSKLAHDSLFRKSYSYHFHNFKIPSNNSYISNNKHNS